MSVTGGSELDPRPKVAVAWRPGRRAAGRIVGAVLSDQLRRRLPDMRLVRWPVEKHVPDGVVGLVDTEFPILRVAEHGTTAAGSLASLVDELDADLLDRRLALLRRVNWLPEAEKRAVIVDVPDGTELAVHGADAIVSLHGGAIEATAPAGGPGPVPYRLPDEVLPVDLVAAVRSAERVLTDHPALAAAADAFAVPVVWVGTGPQPALRRDEMVGLLDAFAGATHINSLRRRPLDVLGAELRGRARVDRLAGDIDRELRRRLRSTRDELADRIVAHELDLSRGETRR